MNNTERELVEVFPPGDFIQEELDARGWLQTDFADILGVDKKSVSDLISGKRCITPEMAVLIGEALGTGPVVWLNLDNEYQIYKNKREKPQDNLVARKAELYAQYPIRDMIKRGWIKPGLGIDDLSGQLSAFYSKPQFPYAARKVNDESKRSLQLAWLYRTHNIAKNLTVSQFSEIKLASAMKELKAHTIARDGLDEIPEILSRAGVRFVINQFLPNSKIDGVCFWLDDRSPVIGLSIRFDRIDNFWFTLMHELHHVRYGHAKEEALLDVEMEEDDSNISDEERQADEGAADFLIPKNELKNFIARVRPAFTPLQIRGFARRMGVHPGIVIGQLHHRKLVDYKLYRKLLVPVREHITSTSTFDGWGVVA